MVLIMPRTSPPSPPMPRMDHDRQYGPAHGSQRGRGLHLTSTDAKISHPILRFARVR
jgi:hypothetical protein